ncbi:MAG TPA: multiple monosaccharide ABC transporter permease [Candidatus Cybelea sp.]|nr:multiple monosaccharide ABC transporter permease [Candidatus Cybelea sp.]
MAQGSTAIPTSVAPHTSLGTYIKHNIRDYALLLALIVIMVFFQVATHGILFRPVNITNLVLQNSYVVIMALGMLLIIVAGHIDLSVGSVVAFVGALAGVLIVQLHWDFALVFLLCLMVGATIGAAQGFFVAYLKIPAFIVTLAGMLVFRGLSLYVLGGTSYGPFPTGFQLLANGFIPSFAGETFKWTSMLIGLAVTAIIIFFKIRERLNQQKHDLAEEPLLIFVGRNVLIALGFLLFSSLLSSSRGLPNVLVVMFALIVLYAFVASSTTIGRRIYALGGNEKAARLSGIRTDRLTFYAFLNMGVLAALAGLVFTARLNSATPQAGLGFELDVIAACFIGGASPTGGVGKIIGAVIGAFIVGVMNNGMSILGIGIDLQQVIKGSVLLAAVCLDVYYKRKA